MANGCLTEVDLFRVFRHEMSDEESSAALYHLLDCGLCREQWKRFQLDEQVAAGIRSAVVGDVAGADRSPGVSDAIALPERFEIPGFRLRGDFIDGGQARVYHAVHEASQEEVAIKMFHNSPLNEGGYSRFSAELQSLARLRHPNVVPIRSAGEIFGHAYFVMPWIEGQPLDAYLKNCRLTMDQRLDLIAKVVGAVDHAHKRGVMHLDLKPSNVWVDQTGEPIVMDFGLARLTSVETAPQTDFAPGIAGTPAYMAPEQVSERGDIDTRTDVFTLGLLLYEALAGRRARQDALDAGKRASELVLMPLPPVRSTCSKVGRELAAVVGMATAMSRDERYQSTTALLDDLDRLRRDEAVMAMGSGIFYRVRKLGRRHVAVLVGVVAIALIVSTAGLLTRELRHMTDTAYQRASQVNRDLQLANQRRLARTYLELAALCDQVGDAERAERYRMQALTIRKRLVASEENPYVVRPAPRRLSE